MAIPLPGAEAWIELILKRGPELRKAGVLSIGSDGHSAVLAPDEPDEPGAGDNATNQAGFSDTDDDESHNAWENGSSYPSGNVPSLTVDRDELPEIPTFGEEG